MTVAINLPSKAEANLRAAAARRGETLEAYLEWLAVQSGGNDVGRATDRTPEEKVAAWREWVASHATNPHVADDSRESIYGDRGG